MPETINPYESPREPSELALSTDATGYPREGARRARFMAAALAIPSLLFWLTTAAPVFMFGALDVLILCSPGYLATYGFCWRAVGSPPLRWCRAIWGCALLVYTLLLAMVVFMAFAWAETWWWGAIFVTCFSIPVVVSAYALFRDPGEPEAGGRPPMAT